MARANKNNKESKKIKCIGTCERNLTLGNTNFYRSNKEEYAKNDGFLNICKKCLIQMCVNKDGTPNIEGIKNALKIMDKPLIKSEYMKMITNGGFNLGDYSSNLNLNYKNLRYADSDFDERDLQTKALLSSIEHTEIIVDTRAKQDCINLLGYDPFVYEPEKDKAQLYNNLIDYLDEATLEDSFKIPTVIQIVKGFYQIDKINAAISEYMDNPQNIINDSSAIKSLLSSKKTMMDSILGMAKENGISINNSNKKSQGAGTLSGILKKLNELDLEEISINLFNIETAGAMKQVADISNKSILDQLNFDENDYTNIIKDQRQMIQDMQTKLEKLEEENRLLNIKLLHYEQQEGDN